MTDDFAKELLLRDSVEITLVVDAGAARTMSDEDIIRVLGEGALQQLRDLIGEEDE